MLETSFGWLLPLIPSHGMNELHQAQRFHIRFTAAHRQTKCRTPIVKHEVTGLTALKKYSISCSTAWGLAGKTAVFPVSLKPQLR